MKIRFFGTASVVLLIIAVVSPFIFIGHTSQESRVTSPKDQKGIITVWHTDMFEGGSGSRSGYLKRLAGEFGKRNKGSYVVVKEVTAYDVEAKLKSGIMPDVLSYSHGLSDEISCVFSEYCGVSEMQDRFKEACTFNGGLRAVPWCFGGYVLICRNTFLDDNGIGVGDLLTNVKTLKKSKGAKWLISVGNAGYNDPLKAIKEESTDAYEYIKNSAEGDKTQYDAYRDFISGRADVLLGTQRDVVRLTKLSEAGRISDFSVYTLCGYTDLVTCFSLTERGMTADERVTATRFIEFVTCGENASRTVEISMLSPSGKSKFSGGNMQTFADGMNSARLKVKGLF